VELGILCLPDIDLTSRGLLERLVVESQAAETESTTVHIPHLRTGEGSNVKHFVGLVVALLVGSGEAAYIGVITGWSVDGSFVTSDGVKSSPENPVYQITYTSTTPSNHSRDIQLRYDLQQHVKTFAAPGVGKSWRLYHIVRSLVQDLGRVFRSAIVNEQRNLWFVPSEEMARDYPGDLEAGRNFMAAPEGYVVPIEMV